MAGKLLRFLMCPSVAFCGTVGALALYCLMLGPIAWLYWNVPLPDWFLGTIEVVYAPHEWLHSTSATFQAIWDLYLQIWCGDFVPATTRANPLIEFPERPPYVIELSGTILGAWLLWNGARWVNQRNVAAP